MGENQNIRRVNISVRDAVRDHYELTTDAPTLKEEETEEKEQEADEPEE